MLVVGGEQQSDVCHHIQHRATGLAVPGSHRLGKGSGSRLGSSMVLSGWQPCVILIPPWQSPDRCQVCLLSEMTWVRVGGGSVPLLGSSKVLWGVEEITLGVRAFPHC